MKHQYSQISKANGARTCRKCGGTINVDSLCLIRHDVYNKRILDYKHLFCSEIVLERFFIEAEELIDENYSKIIKKIIGIFNEEKKIIIRNAKQHERVELIRAQERKREIKQEEKRNRKALKNFLIDKKKQELTNIIIKKEEEQKTPPKRDINDICNEMYERGELSY